MITAGGAAQSAPRLPSTSKSEIKTTMAMGSAPGSDVTEIFPWSRAFGLLQKTSTEKEYRISRHASYFTASKPHSTRPRLGLRKPGHWPVNCSEPPFQSVSDRRWPKKDTKRACLRTDLLAPRHYSPVRQSIVFRPGRIHHTSGVGSCSRQFLVIHCAGLAASSR